MSDTFKVRIDRIAPEGDGIGKREDSEKVVFVPHSLPGDVLEVRLTDEESRFQRAEILRVLELAAHRIEPPCPYHFKPGLESYCGGCDWQHAAYEEQLRLKRRIVLDCLKRIAKLGCPVLETLPSPTQWRYRNKVQIPFQASKGREDGCFRPAPASDLSAGTAREENCPRAGFYVPGTHRIVEFEDCRVQPEISIAIFNTVKALAREHRWSIYDEDKDRGWLRHLYIRTNLEGRALVAFVTRMPTFPNEKRIIGELMARHLNVVGVWQNVQDRKTSVILGPRWRKLAGADRMRETIGSLTLEFSPGAFLQVNTPAAEALYRTAEEFIFDDGFDPRLILDIYSGVGAIALWMVGRREVGAGRKPRDVPSTRIIGIEEVPQAVEDAYHNARRLGLRQVSFVQGKAEFALRRMKGLDAPRPWAAVLDPPRSGCEEGVLKFLARSRVERIVYVSCNPATFARDARRLADSGYRLRRIQPVDLFPQTSHVELVAQIDYDKTSAVTDS